MCADTLLADHLNHKLPTKLFIDNTKRNTILRMVSAFVGSIIAPRLRRPLGPLPLY
ncbi:hypothetical protein AGR6A_pTi0039 [Agrobacterium sp. NCPPB 925]|nr:hypothetical protein AGR6A_pTi0039 [Agrobacterium sp. NCPPB 925]